MPKAYPEEFRRDVVAVARKGQAPLTQIAKDFGISESCLANWLKKADIEDGNRPGVTRAESEELRELRKRNKLLEQENEILRRAADSSLASCPQKMFPGSPLVLAAGHLQRVRQETRPDPSARPAGPRRPRPPRIHRRRPEPPVAYRYQRTSHR